ncbi:MAG: TorF family putative porin [Rhodocyclaceae bacterium]|nr:TorF family putative porin [Rhodocyclaceae bacterium]
MSKMILKAAVAAACVSMLSGAALAEEVSANVGFVSDYQYRGYSQSNENMALQGGFDYAHDSGLYVGVWGSSIDWLAKGGLEVDVYAGYANSIGDFGYDVGVLQYFYPGGETSGGDDADTTEAYIGVSWKFISFKYSYAFTDLFGATNSDGSQYYDLSAEYDLGNGFGVSAHFGRQDIENATGYNDWKVGVSKEYAGFTFGVDYVDTDVDNDDNADERVIVSVSKSF